MNERHRTHLIVGHAPVIGVLIGIGLLIWGLLSGGTDMKQASRGLFVISALITAAAVVTETPPSEQYKTCRVLTEQRSSGNAPGRQEAAIVTYVLGAASVASFYWAWRRNRLPDGLMCLCSSCAGRRTVLARASKSGGSIRQSHVASACSTGGSHE